MARFGNSRRNSLALALPWHLVTIYGLSLQVSARLHGAPASGHGHPCRRAASVQTTSARGGQSGPLQQHARSSPVARCTSLPRWSTCRLHESNSVRPRPGGTWPRAVVGFGIEQVQVLGHQRLFGVLGQTNDLVQSVRQHCLALSRGGILAQQWKPAVRSMLPYRSVSVTARWSTLGRSRQVA